MNNKLSKRSFLLKYAIPSVLAVTLILIIFLVDRVNLERDTAESRARVQHELIVVRDRLETRLNGDLQLTKGLVSTITLNPNLNQQQFETAVRPLFAGRNHLRNIAAAPGMVIKLIYPIAGNEKAIGLDFRKVPGQYAAAERARLTREIILAGPLKLVQGGTGLIARLPVFLPDTNGQERFWGLVSAVIDANHLFEDVGLERHNLPIEIAVRGKDAKGDKGEVFFGRGDLFHADPVLTDIELPAGSWQLAAIPQGGWQAQSGDIWLLRLSLAALALLIIGIYLFLYRTLEKVSVARASAESTRQLLDSILEQIPNMVFLKDATDLRFTLVNSAAEALLGFKRKDLLGKSDYDLFPKKQADYFTHKDREVLRTSVVSEIPEETIDTHLHGRRILYTKKLALHNDQGEVEYLLGISDDITERKLTSQAILRHSQELAKLLELGQELSASLELGKVLQIAADRIAEFTAFETSAVYLVEGETLHLAATLPPLPANFPDALCHAPLAAHPHIRRAVEAQQVVFLSDTAQADLTPAEQEVIELRKLRSVIYLPLRVGKEVAGVLIPATIGERKVRLEEVSKVCRAYANLCALAIANAKLYESSRDYSERLKRQYSVTHEVVENLRESERKYRSLMEYSPLAIQEVSPEGKTIRVNRAWERLWGMPSSALETYNLLQDRELLDRGLMPVIQKVFAGKAAEIPAYEYDKANMPAVPPQTGKLWVRTFLYPLLGGDGRLREVVLIQEDVTAQKKQEKRILHQAHYDALTDLPNRLLSLDRLSQLINEADRSKKRVAVLFLDLDDFKKINDTLGHDTGDKLLKEAAVRLRDAVRREDTVGRLGGDEFIVLIGGVADAADVRQVAEALLARFMNSFSIDNRELVLTLSIGIAVYPDDGDKASRLLRSADSAMYYSKAQGRNTYSFFTEEMNHGVTRRLHLEEQMHGALSRSEFRVSYQTKVDIVSRKVIGVEALLRWHNPALGDVSPKEFIPIAEQTGLIVPIGQFVLTEALDKVVQWRNEFGQSFTVAVNLSPRQFRDPNLVAFIESTLRKTGTRGPSLELEITEGVLMSGHAYIDEALAALSQLEISLAMDDFGTGYSSLSYLRSYPFNVIKIDREFIKDMTSDPGDRELVNAAIAMAHSLDLKVVAEGVETQEQLALLSAQGCDIAQGFFFSKPISAAEMTRRLEAETGVKSLRNRKTRREKQ